MERFANVLMRSGYSQKVRAEVISGVIVRDRQMEEQGVVPRSGEQIRADKKLDMRRHKNTWFLRGEATSVMMVQATKGGALAKRLRKGLLNVRAPDGGTTSVVERAGQSILAGLRKADPVLGTGCQWQERVCPVEDGKSCWTSRVVYALQCTACSSKYVGTTGLTLHARGLQHLEALVGGNMEYPMTRHYSQAHPEVQPGRESLKIKAITGHIPDNARRYIGEAIAIQMAKDEGEPLLNSRGEWGRVRLRRLAVTEDG